MRGDLRVCEEWEGPRRCLMEFKSGGPFLRSRRWGSLLGRTGEVCVEGLGGQGTIRMALHKVEPLCS